MKKPGGCLSEFNHKVHRENYTKKYKRGNTTLTAFVKTLLHFAVRKIRDAPHGKQGKTVKIQALTAVCVRLILNEAGPYNPTSGLHL